jgi:hypothetical protein
MRYFFCILAFVEVLLTGCVQDLKTSDTKPSSSILGTWQAVSGGEIPIKPGDGLIYVRYYPDGKFAMWAKSTKYPLPKSLIEFHGNYHLDGNVLVFDSDSGNKLERKVEIKRARLPLLFQKATKPMYLFYIKLFQTLNRESFHRISPPTAHPNCEYDVVA